MRRALGTVSTISLAIISRTASSPNAPSGMAMLLINCASQKLRGEHAGDGRLKLIVRIGLAQTVRAFDEQALHGVGEVVAGGVEHAHVRAQPHRLARDIAAAQDGL